MFIHQVSMIAWSALSPMEAAVTLKDFEDGSTFGFKLSEAAVQEIGEIVRKEAAAKNVRIDGHKINPEVPSAPLLTSQPIDTSNGISF